MATRTRKIGRERRNQQIVFSQLAAHSRNIKEFGVSWVQWWIMLRSCVCVRSLANLSFYYVFEFFAWVVSVVLCFWLFENYLQQRQGDIFGTKNAVQLRQVSYNAEIYQQVDYHGSNVKDWNAKKKKAIKDLVSKTKLLFDDKNRFFRVNIDCIKSSCLHMCFILANMCISGAETF